MILYFVLIAPLFKSIAPNFTNDFHNEKHHKRNVHSKLLPVLLCVDVYIPKTWLLQLNVWNSSVKSREAGTVTEFCHKEAHLAWCTPFYSESISKRVLSFRTCNWGGHSALQTLGWSRSLWLRVKNLFVFTQWGFVFWGSDLRRRSHHGIASGYVDVKMSSEYSVEILIRQLKLWDMKVGKDLNSWSKIGRPHYKNHLTVWNQGDTKH